MSEKTESIQYDKNDVKAIAKFQRIMCFTFFIPIVAVFPVYYLARALKVKHPGLYAFGMFFGIVNLFVLVSVIRQATRVLRSKGIRVGLIGYKKGDLNKYLSESN